MAEDHAVCRGCGIGLVDAWGKPARPYYTGEQNAYHPTTKVRAKANHYGGFVCSQTCDYRSALRLEQDMPGHGGQTRLSPPLSTRIAERWEGANG